MKSKHFNKRHVPHENANLEQKTVQSVMTWEKKIEEMMELGYSYEVAYNSLLVSAKIHAVKFGSDIGASNYDENMICSPELWQKWWILDMWMHTFTKVVVFPGVKFVRSSCYKNAVS